MAGINGPKIGDAPPPLVLSETIQGPSPNEIRWNKLKGKVVVLEFWQTACAPCIEAITDAAYRSAFSFLSQSCEVSPVILCGVVWLPGLPHFVPVNIAILGMNDRSGHTGEGMPMNRRMPRKKEDYSCRSASIGLRFAACHAGYIPQIIQI